MSTQVFLLPDLGEGLTEAELVSWLVKVGDPVVVDQAVAEVETAKAVVEVPSPFAGTVAELHGAAGQTLDVGKPLISITSDAEGGDGASSAGSSTGAGRAGGSTGSTAASGAAGSGEAGAAAGAANKAAGPSAVPVSAPGPAVVPAGGAGSGNVLIGYGTTGTGASGRTRPRKGQPAGWPTNGPTEAAAPAEPAPELAVAPLVSSPLVRRLARDGGIALRTLHGSGPDGMIQRRDVEAAIAGSKGSAAGIGAADAPVSSSPGAADGTGADPRTGLTVTSRRPFTGLRKAVAASMTRSRREIPEATVWVDVDATALVELRAALKRKNPDSTPGLLAFVARFALAGLVKFPELNTRVETVDGGEQLVSFDGVNLGFAVQADRGLVVPSIEHAEKLSAKGLDAEIRALTATARAGKATVAQLGRGTFTLNNYGVFGVDGSAAIINHPEVAMLGIGRILDRPWVVEGQLAVRKMSELTLVFDHRVCDGGTAGGFLRFVADAIENPAELLAEL